MAINRSEGNLVDVKMLAQKLGVEPIKVRRVLRLEGIKPKKVEVPEGWPNQKRRQYVWDLRDPELKKVLVALQTHISKQPIKL